MIPRRLYRLTPIYPPRVVLTPRKIAICLYLAAVTGVFVAPVAAQSYGGNSGYGGGNSGSGYGGGMSSSGINNSFPGGSSSGGSSSGGSFRPNNSTFGSPLGLNTGPSGLADPFSQARANPAAQGSAVAGIGNQQNALRMQQGIGGNMGFGQNGLNNAQRTAANRQGTNNNRRTQTKRVPTVVRVNMDEFMRDLAVGARTINTPVLPPTIAPNTIRGAKDVNVAVGADGVVTLTGTVANPRAAEVAAALMSLEPGVRRVDSQLAVESLNP